MKRFRSRLTRFQYHVQCQDPDCSYENDIYGDKPKLIREVKQHIKQTGHREFEWWQWDTFHVDLGQEAE